MLGTEGGHKNDLNINHYSSPRKVMSLQEFCNYRISDLVIMGGAYGMYGGKEKCTQEALGM
jgi:hypothetical protein